MPLKDSEIKWIIQVTKSFKYRGKACYIPRKGANSTRKATHQHKNPRLELWVPPAWKIKWQNKVGHICLDNTTGRCGSRSFLSQPKITFSILPILFTLFKSCCNKYSPPTPSSTCTALSRQDKILLRSDFSMKSGDGKWDPKITHSIYDGISKPVLHKVTDEIITAALASPY